MHWTSHAFTTFFESAAEIKIKRALRLLYENASATAENKSYFIKLVDRTIKLILLYILKHVAA